MSLNGKTGQYPYSKNRVLLSVIIAALSTFLALTLLLGDIGSMLYYLFFTFILTVLTYLLKKRLYSYLIADDIEAEDEEGKKQSSWRILSIAFLMLVGSIAIPLLLAGLVSGLIWFIAVTSFTSGVSISEIVMYVQATGDRRRPRRK